jgi:hypothetical protein
MAYVIAQSTPCNMVDISAKVQRSAPAEVSAKGYSGIIRYVPLPGVDPSADIDASELKGILDAGLALLLVQHVRYAGWNPAKCSGHGDALRAIEFAEAAGYLQGGHVFLDLEGISGSAADTKTFAEDWASTIVQAGYGAGCYVGYDVTLNAVQLYNLHNIHSYWGAPGPWQVATRGFALRQKTPKVTIANLEFDPDSLQADNLGDTPFWMISQSAQPSA